MKILAVDDDVVSRELLADILRADGHEVSVASGGEEAARLLAASPVRMVITDWMMPGMDGLELCRWIRSHPTTQYVYVIILSARSKTVDLIEGLNSGADEFLAKPVDPGELRARIRTGVRILALESRHVAIFGMAKLAESRDPETGLHLERIQIYARILATHYRVRAGGGALTPEYIDTLYLTSPLHDIGKVGIPDNVLLKPGRLDDDEFNIMKTHTLIGAATLDAALKQYPDVPYLQMARDIALLHHERFDGKGYPKGLSGESIPLCARITALADVYDALTSRRVYKTAETHHVARSIILAESGCHFDPRVVDAFIAGEKEIARTESQLTDQAAARDPA